VLGECRIVTVKSGGLAVWNGKRGANGLLIPCRSRQHAEEILQRLEHREHDGELWI
jgi:hypothetical protein